MLNVNVVRNVESVAVVVTTSLLVIELAGALAATPPPVRYLIVNVVLLGAKPYVLVNKKFDGSNALSIWSTACWSPYLLTISGEGKKSSSLSPTTPDPNCI